MNFKQLLFLMTFLSLFLCLRLLLPGSPALAAEKKGSDCCDVILLRDAAVFLGVSSGNLQKNVRTVMVSPDDIRKKIYKSPPCSCSIRSKSNFLKSISYTIYHYNDPRQARRDFNTMKNNFAAASKVDNVKGLGSEVLWAGDKRFHRMVALKGAVLIDVINPADFNIQKRILRLILDKF